MLKDTHTKQRVKVTTDESGEYLDKIGMFHYTDENDPDLCTVTFGDGIPTYFHRSELSPLSSGGTEPLRKMNKHEASVISSLMIQKFKESGSRQEFIESVDFLIQTKDNLDVIWEILFATINRD